MGRRALSVKEAAALLQVSPADIGSAPAVLKAAFLRQALQWHPDVNPSPEATKRFQELHDALTVCVTARSGTRRSGGADDPSHGGDPPADSRDGTGWSSSSSAVHFARTLEQLHETADGVLRRAGVYAPSKAVQAIAVQATRDHASRSLERVASACVALKSSTDELQHLVASFPAALCGDGSAFDSQVCPSEDVFFLQSGARQFEAILPRLVARLVQALPKQLMDAGVSPADYGQSGTYRPTVLIGALAFTLVNDADAPASASHSPSQREWPEGLSAALATTCAELRCVVRLPKVVAAKTTKEDRAARRALLLTAITPAFVDWQAASVRRWALERRTQAAFSALSRVTGLLPALDGPTAFSQFQNPRLPLQHTPNLSWCHEQAATVADVVEALTAAGSAISAAAGDPSEPAVALGAQVTAGGNWADGSNVVCLDLAVLPSAPAAAAEAALQLRRCLKSIHLTAVLMKNTDDDDASAGDDNTATTTFRVLRTPSACRAEDTGLELYVKLFVGVDTFTSLCERLASAIHAAGRKTVEARELLPRIVAQRDAIEGVSAAGSSAADALLSSFLANPMFDEPSRCSLVPVRGASPAVNHVKCFSRLFALGLAEEARFWDHVERKRQALDQQQAVVGSINVRFVDDDVKPYHDHDRRQEPVEDAPGGGSMDDDVSASFGWIGRDAEGNDEVTIGTPCLASEAAFDAWVDDVMLQCCLSRQADGIVRALGLGYVRRDPQLPMTQYLSFLHRYKGSSARGVLEAQAARVGLAMGPVRVVSHELVIAVSPSGELVVPWDVDPASIITAFAPSPPMPSSAALPQ